tara:strand:+ start:443 stop:1402 length:960 start_codon:yes stop_codon:yes gene_type:complete
MINKERIAFKPFQYQWAYDYWFKQQNAHWLHTEINMAQDIKDWNENLNEDEKETIGNILKGFTQTETQVGNYWSSYIPQWFPVPEIKMMGQTFGAFETIHAVAYSYLNDSLGLDNFEEFLEDEATMRKLEVLMKVDPNTGTIRDKARSIALFSAAAEGIQLFSSFAILLSFRKSNRLTGIGQQMIFSVRDESLHSEAGCKIFRTIIEENPDIWDEELKNSIYQGIDLAIQNEFHYIDSVFTGKGLETISKEQLKNFMLDRANRKLVELSLEPIYQVDDELFKEMKWFYILVSGEQQTDFFANRETNYSKPNEDWEEDLF